MSTYDEFYTENRSLASITLGREKLTGHLIMNALVQGPNNREVLEPILVVDLQSMVVTLGSQQTGQRVLLDMDTIVIDAKTSTVTIDGAGRNQPATFAMRSSFNFDTIYADADAGLLSVGNFETSGQLHIRNGRNIGTIRGYGADGRVEIGGGNTNGRIELSQGTNDTRVVLDARQGLTLKSEAGTDTVILNGEEAQATIGGIGQAGTLSICDSGGQTRIEMTGQNGDIRFAGADLAEEFTVARQALPFATAGSVMVLDDFGTMTPCTTAYDHRVVGVIAGAGAYRPAMILDRQDGEDRRPVAMIGKVSCYVSAKVAPVRIGDLLTTSDITGHAQVATEKDRAFGCIIGKALGPLESGSGLIPVLVNLQ